MAYQRITPKQAEALRERVRPILRFFCALPTTPERPSHRSRQRNSQGDRQGSRRRALAERHRPLRLDSGGVGRPPRDEEPTEESAAP